MRFSQWTVWLANLDPVVGSEQGRTRPVLIISKSSLNSILPVVNVIPLTSRKEQESIDALRGGASRTLCKDLGLEHQPHDPV